MRRVNKKGLEYMTEIILAMIIQGIFFIVIYGMTMYGDHMIKIGDMELSLEAQGTIFGAGFSPSVDMALLTLISSEGTSSKLTIADDIILSHYYGEHDEELLSKITEYMGDPEFECEQTSVDINYICILDLDFSDYELSGYDAYIISSEGTCAEDREGYTCIDENYPDIDVLLSPTDEVISYCSGIIELDGSDDLKGYTCMRDSYNEASARHGTGYALVINYPVTQGEKEGRTIFLNNILDRNGNVKDLNDRYSAKLWLPPAPVVSNPYNEDIEVILYLPY